MFYFISTLTQCLKRFASPQKLAQYFTALACIVCIIPLSAQETEMGIGRHRHSPKTEDEALTLPAAEVSAQKESAEHITQEQMRERGDNDLFEAIRWIPGVSQNNGHSGRDEDTFNIRGLTGADVPVYVDGVPWGNFYDGRVDYGRFLTGDVESIDIMKGYSSVLFGPNNLGGAIIMRLAKPKKKIDISTHTSIDLDGGGYAGTVDAISAGTRMGLFYAKAGVQYRSVEHWRLPDSFTPSGGMPGSGGNPQGSGNRLWSDSYDMVADAMLGVTPFPELDIWATYNYSTANKGFAPPEVTGNNYVIWDWPFMTRHTATLHGEWNGERLNAKLLAYFNKYNESLHTYPSFSMGGSGGGDTRWQAYLDGRHSISDYDDYTTGVKLEGGLAINDWNTIQAAFQFMQTGRKNYESSTTSIEYNDDSLSYDYADTIYFGGVEYSFNPYRPLTAVLGIGLDISDSLRLFRKNREHEELSAILAPQWSAGLFYDLNENHELHLSYAKKNRFPTLQDKASMQEYTSSGRRNKANFDLRPVQMHHFEFGYKGYFYEMINIKSTVYYSYQLDKIARVAINDGVYATQYQNVEKSMFWGFEFSAEMYLNNYFTVGGVVGATKYKILHSESDYTYMGRTPELTANGYMVVYPFAGIDTKVVKNIKIIPRFEYAASRYADSYTESADRVLLPSYMLAHLKLAMDITQFITFSCAVNNVFDELYEIWAGFPEAGRSFTLSIEAKY